MSVDINVNDDLQIAKTVGVNGMRVSKQKPLNPTLSRALGKYYAV